MATAASAAAAATQTEHHGRGNATATTIAKSGWGPYSGAGDFAGNMAVILASLLAALALTLAIHAGVRHLLRRRRQRLERNGGAAAADPENPPPVEAAPAPALLVLVYSAAGTELAGAASECAICLAEFADGDAVRTVLHRAVARPRRTTVLLPDLPRAGLDPAAHGPGTGRHPQRPRQSLDAMPQQVPRSQIDTQHHRLRVSPLVADGSPALPSIGPGLCRLAAVLASAAPAWERAGACACVTG